MAPVKTYKGKKPCLSLKVPPISPFRKEDSFDKLFGQRRTVAHVFSSSSEASASHSRLNVLTPESISYDRSQRKFFELKDTEKVPTPVSSVSGITRVQIKKRAGKKSDVLLNLEALRNLKSKRRLQKRIVKKKEPSFNFLQNPLGESTPLKSSEPFSKTESALLAQSSSSLLSSQTTELQHSSTDSIVAKFGHLNFEENSVRESKDCQPSSSHLALDNRNFQVLDSDEAGDIVRPLNLENTFTLSPIPACSMSSGAADNSVKSCFERSVDRLTGSPSDAPHSASTAPTTQRRLLTSQPSGSSTAFAGFDAEAITPLTLNKKYQWLAKKKTCDMVDETPRRAVSMHDIILASRSNQIDSSEHIASTVRQPCKKLITDASLSSPVSENVGGVGDSPSVRQPRTKMNITGASVRSSLHSKHYTTCDEMPLGSSASSGDSPDSCRSSDDLSRESFNEEDEEENMVVNRPNLPSKIPLHSLYEQRILEPLQENLEEMEEESSSLSSKSSPAETPDSGSNRTPNMRRKASRYSEERSPTGRSSIGRALATPDLNCVVEESDSDSVSSDQIGELQPLEQFILIPGKKYRRSLSILRNLENQGIPESTSNKGKSYQESVEEVIRLQNSAFCGGMSDVSVSLQSLKQRLSIRRSMLPTPPSRRRSTIRHSIYETPGSLFSCGSSSGIFKGLLDGTLLTPGLPPFDSARASFKPDVSCTPEKDYHDTSPVAPNSNISSPAESLAQPTVRDLILGICRQTDFVSFSDLLKKECYDGASKLGEGVYGEVFGIRRGERTTVIKIIPLEGNFCVNDANQKTYEEICPELLISMELNSLRYEETHNNYYLAHGFVEIVKIALVQGSYPPELLELWSSFNEHKGSDNDNPKIFEDDQIYIVIEQANGGQDLESYSFSTAKQVVSVFKQIAFSLAVAESAMEFEHRDLHWGNVLVSRTKDMKISYWLKDVEYKIPANGVKGTIIDYTLSRILYRNTYPMNCDLSKDPELFLGSGDLQFDVYRQMKKDVGNEWTRHVPKTNVRWLHYLLDKMQKRVKYQRKTATVHRDNMMILQQIESWIDSCDSAYSVALQLHSMK